MKAGIASTSVITICILLMVSTIVYKWAFNRGEELGFTKGKISGEQVGYERGFNEGRNDALNDGLEKGLLIGISESKEALRLAVDGSYNLFVDENSETIVPVEFIVDEILAFDDLSGQAEYDRFSIVSDTLNKAILRTIADFSGISSKEEKELIARYNNKKRAIIDTIYTAYKSQIDFNAKLHGSNFEADRVKDFANSFSGNLCNVVDLFSPAQKVKLAMELAEKGSKRLGKKGFKNAHAYKVSYKEKATNHPDSIGHVEVIADIVSNRNANSNTLRSVQAVKSLKDNVAAHSSGGITLPVSEYIETFLGESVCDILVSESLGLVVDLMEEYSIMKNFTEQLLIAGHTRNTEMIIRAVVDTLWIEQKKVLDKGFMGVELQVATKTNAAIAAGVNLKKHFDIDIRNCGNNKNCNNEIIITVPKPEIISRDLDFNLKVVNEKIHKELKDSQINYMYRFTKNFAEDEALKKGILKDAEASVRESFEAIYGPILPHMNKKYDIVVRFVEPTKIKDAGG